MEDFKAAMKAHDEAAKNTISFARAAVKQYEIDHTGYGKQKDRYRKSCDQTV